MKRRGLLLSLLLFVLAAAASVRLWAPSIGTFLLRETPNPKPADAVVVLAGDGYGNRIIKGAELVRDGMAPIALVSGPSHLYGVSEARLAIDFAVRKGFDRAKFEAIDLEYYSTEEEAEKIAKTIAARNMHRVMVVTSNYHTRRAGRIWQRAGAANGFETEVAAAPDKDLVMDIWWQNREGRKKLFYEWVKVITSQVGM